jgi:glyoxalase family protein
MVTTPGIHHVTAIGGDPERNAAFYVGVLGLRLVKRTVNHDDTDTYHLYYGDAVGTPGTNVTFFPWTDAGRQGEFGAGQTQSTAFSIPADSVDYWADRLDAHGVGYEREERHGETVLRFADPDGIGLELVAGDGERPGEHWEAGPVPAEHQVRGFYGVTLAVAELGPTAEVLEGIGFERVEEGAAARAADASNGDGRESDGRVRFDTGADRIGTVVDLVETDVPRGTMGVGTVHHVAFELPDESAQAEMRERLAAFGADATEVIDRTYFRAIYAREPGGVLFEFSTPDPGFAVDEDVDSLGEQLVLPAWLEDRREGIEASLPPFDYAYEPGSETASADD